MELPNKENHLHIFNPTYINTRLFNTIKSERKSMELDKLKFSIVLTTFSAMTVLYAGYPSSSQKYTLGKFDKILLSIYYLAMLLQWLTIHWIPMGA